MSDKAVPLSLRIRPGIECAPWVISNVLKLETELAALRAQVETMRKDAERYRWLRQHPINFADESWGKYGAGLPLDKLYVNSSAKLDAAIDAALQPPEAQQPQQAEVRDE